jgi:hypothetical protein
VVESEESSTSRAAGHSKHSRVLKVKKKKFLLPHTKDKQHDGNKNINKEKNGVEETGANHLETRVCVGGGEHHPTNAEESRAVENHGPSFRPRMAERPGLRRGLSLQKPSLVSFGKRESTKLGTRSRVQHAILPSRQSESVPTGLARSRQGENGRRFIADRKHGRERVGRTSRE